MICTRMLEPSEWIRGPGGNWNKYVAYNDEIPSAKYGYGQTAAEAYRDYQSKNEEKPE